MGMLGYHVTQIGYNLTLQIMDILALCFVLFCLLHYCHLILCLYQFICNKILPYWVLKLLLFYYSTLLLFPSLMTGKVKVVPFHATNALQN